MTELWGVGPDARRVGRPVLLAAGLGIAAFAVAFGVALALGRSLAGSAATALLLPLAISGALALGLGVAFVVSTAVTQPGGAARAARLLTVVAPVATLVAFFAYSTDPGAPVRVPFAAAPSVSVPLPTRPATSVEAPPVTPPTTVTSEGGSGTGSGTTGGTGSRGTVPFVGPVAAPPLGPLVRPARGTPTVTPDAPEAPGLAPRPAPLVDGGPLRPAIDEPVSPREGTSYRPGSSGCRGRHRGLGRIRRGLRPRPCKAP